jgi:hypothetical protein
MDSSWNTTRSRRSIRIMSTINVNFEITGVNSDRGVMYIKYWADGATIERFQSEIGPYEVAISSSMDNITEQELNTIIGTFGAPIVLRQKEILDVSNNLIATLTAEINEQKTVVVNLPTP